MFNFIFQVKVIFKVSSETGSQSKSSLGFNYPLYF